MQILVLGFLCLALPISANAYFDPGTGSIIIQALIGAMAAVTVFWGQLKTYVQSLFSSQSSKATSHSGSADDLESDSAKSDELQ